MQSAGYMAGDSPAGRLKASITRSVNQGVKVPKAPKAPKVKTAKVAHDGDMDAPKLKPYTGRMKFLGSMKFGGKIKKTGLYLMHKDEHVKSPYNRRRER